MTYVVQFPDGVTVGPFETGAEADAYLSSFPGELVDDVEVVRVRAPKAYPAPQRWELDSRVP